MNMPVADGFFALFKVPGVSSARQLDMAKRSLGVNKAGFLGTLDVPAAGVLPVALGAATRLIPYLPATDKEYIGELILGLSTVTDDVVGEVVDRCDASGVSEAAIRLAVKNVAARGEQAPPHVSAKWRNGIRGYDAVRKHGRFLDFSPTAVAVRRVDVLRSTNVNALKRVVLSMTVSPGFYVRAFCRDVGSELGCCACMGRLLRTCASGFAIRDTVSVRSLQQKIMDGNRSFVVSGLESRHLLGSLPSLALNMHQWNDFSHGIAVDCDVETDAIVVVVCPDGRLGGVARVHGRKAQPVKVFPR